MAIWAAMRALQWVFLFCRAVPLLRLMPLSRFGLLESMKIAARLLAEQQP
jgi:hypothetical protein